MALSKEEFLKLRKYGLSVEQIIESEKKQAQQKAQKIERYQQETAQLKSEAERLKTPAGMAGSF